MKKLIMLAMVLGLLLFSRVSAAETSIPPDWRLVSVTVKQGGMRAIYEFWFQGRDGKVYLLLGILEAPYDKVDLYKRIEVK
jgi:hypothetical protein